MNRRAKGSAAAACCLWLLLCAAATAQEVALGGAGRKITTVSAVRVRSAPQVGAQELARLKLGAVVSADARTAEQAEVGGRRDYWYRVSLPGGGQGWVFGALLADYDPARRAEIVRRLVEERLKVEGMSFDDASDFYDFLGGELQAAKEPALRGELELARLHALNRAAGAMGETEQGKPANPEFHRAHERELYRHEFAGGWAVKPEAFWELEAKHRGTPVGDRVAWDAAHALRQGECEGDDVCNFLAFQETEGKYLGLYPKGAHAAEALRNLAEALGPKELDATLKSRGGDRYLAETRTALRKALAELRAAVSKTEAPERAAVLRRLDELAPAGR